MIILPSAILGSPGASAPFGCQPVLYLLRIFTPDSGPPSRALMLQMSSAPALNGKTLHTMDSTPSAKRNFLSLNQTIRYKDNGRSGRDGRLSFPRGGRGGKSGLRRAGWPLTATPGDRGKVPQKTYRPSGRDDLSWEQGQTSLILGWPYRSSTRRPCTPP